MKLSKAHLSTGVKLLVGVLLIFYVLRSNMVDFNQLRQVIFNPYNLLIALAFLFNAAFFVTLRWWMLMRAQGLTISLKDAFGLTMIGNFFNTFMPGSVGGDLIKAWYVAGRESKQKTIAVFTVLLDRVIGLLIIVGYAAVTLAIYREWALEKRELYALGLFLWIGVGLSALFFGLFFIPSIEKLPLTQKIFGFVRSFSVAGKILDATLLYRNRMGVVILGLLSSGMSVTGIILLWSLQGSAINIDLTLSQYFFIVPIGLTASAIPLLPGGIGVGQVAFFTLFQWMNIPNPEQGGTLCTLMQIYNILFNCIGAIFYVRYKNVKAGTVQEKAPVEGVPDWEGSIVQEPL